MTFDLDPNLYSNPNSNASRERIPTLPEELYTLSYTIGGLATSTVSRDYVIGDQLSWLEHELSKYEPGHQRSQRDSILSQRSWIENAMDTAEENDHMMSLHV